MELNILLFDHVNPKISHSQFVQAQVAPTYVHIIGPVSIDHKDRKNV